MMSKQTQEGGDNSSNYQAKEMTVNISGIDEKRAREIFEEKHVQLRKDYSEEAMKIAQTRIDEFENRLMPKLKNVEGALEAFADPSFQLLLVEAQKTAAATERPADYDLLSELLVHRFQKGENRIVRAGISRAVKIVDEISDDALLGLTVLHATGQFLPATGDIRQGLNILDSLFGKIFYLELPTGRDWLEHLEILNTVRLDSFNTLKKVEIFYSEQLSGYVDSGIRKDSENFRKAIIILKNNNMPQSFLVDHTLNSDFVRIPVVFREVIDKLFLLQLVEHDGKLIQKRVGLTIEQVKAVNDIYNLYDENEDTRNENINAFTKIWDQHTHLKMLRKWWNDLNNAFKLTSVGKVLAHSNAQRCDNNLPPLD
ncbi:hypothetical protein KPY62_08860 [Psychrobacter sp. TAE2020]|uniref:LPO_1073/Vpar_1526 family protein n=1 Tax=Psychrobacter sp. TAE2020 TaxID=2846762 RepID=UPI001C0FBE19|nr:LPO_1073/Vpar_1526 family protein [Psychrobacter sp. TAE2020]MBU5617195.1 hypothetical protein [Psychrobacter sp. TAE2020]